MRIFITGATGFVGQPLCERLLRDGHQLTRLVRNVRIAQRKLGTELALVSTRDDDTVVGRALNNCDAVINLAGEGVLDGRWTKERRVALYGSRIDTTNRLVGLLGKEGRRPSVFISGSAVGYYGTHPKGTLTETSPAGDGFLADLCADWENAANTATQQGLRVVNLRTGIVLGRSGGALAKLLPLFKKGLGSRMGTGTQPMPWIHIRDMIEIIVSSLNDSAIKGPINVVSPNPVSNAEFTGALASSVAKRSFVPVPAFALKLALGDGASVLLGGQRAVPSALLRTGYSFAFPTLKSALDNLAVTDPQLTIGRADSLPPSSYLKARGARYQLSHETRIDAPLSEVFEFFSNAENLRRLTPSTLGFTIDSPLPIEMRPEASIDYTIRLHRVPMRWRTEIEQYQPQGSFVDVQLSGPYRSWWHQHSFQADGDQTIMNDRVLYSMPLGPLGWFAHRLLVRSMLTQIFDYRSKAMELHFSRKRPNRIAASKVA